MDPATPSPTGTVTFLFTDIEGSTRLWEQHPEAMQHALARHDALLTGCIEQHGGVVIKSRGEGDSFFAVFARASEAVAAACTLQQLLLAEPWPAETPLRVRVALHTGEALSREGDYYGPAVNRCARLRAAAYGGQVLLSEATQALVREELPAGVALKDLGSHRLRDLQRAEPVYQLLRPDLPADFPPLHTLSTQPNNLPQELTSFIGREKEIAAVKQRLVHPQSGRPTRLLTLTGVGGTGKTRLSLQVAAEVMAEYPDGVWLVELAPLADPALVPQAVATALSVREAPGVPLTQTLARHLQPRHLLLILDNCEHLLAACAQLAETILRQCPAVTILASSREGLAMAGESLYRVPSLSLPGPKHLASGEADLLPALMQNEAVQLFVDRAAAVRPGFAVTPTNAPVVAQLCHRLDGIPLALELAAARVKALPVEKLHERLDDMFRLLTGGSRTALPRQQTLRALIDWSYDLLSPSEQALFRPLSVFAGGWTLEAAEAVGVGEGVEEWEVLDLLTSLVEKSLVVYEEQGGEGRYRLLETVRQYARDRLQEGGEAEAVRGRHAAYFLQLAERAEPELRRPEQVFWSDRLELEHDNLRAALAWFGSAEERAEAHSRLTSALSLFWYRRGYFREGRRWTEEALSRGQHAPAPIRAKVLHAAGQLAYSMGDYAAADAHLEKSVALARAAGEQWDAALSFFHWALLAIVQGEYARATAHAQEALTLAQEVDDPWLRAVALLALGRAALHQGDPVAARAFLEESLALSFSSGDGFVIARATADLGAVALSRGERELAGGLYREALIRCQEVADQRGIAACLCGLAAVAVPGQPERAARLFGAAEVLREALGSPYLAGMTDPVGYDDHVAALRAQLDAETFAAAWAAGRAMSLEAAIRFALEEGADG